MYNTYRFLNKLWLPWSGEAEKKLKNRHCQQNYAAKTKKYLNFFSIIPIFGYHGKLWAIFGLFGLFWDRFGPYCAISSSLFGHYRETILDNFGPFQTISDHFGPFWIFLDLSGPFWTFLDLSGPFWTILDHFGPFWTIMDHPELFWTILDYCVL